MPAASSKEKDLCDLSPGGIKFLRETIKKLDKLQPSPSIANSVYAANVGDKIEYVTDYNNFF